MKRPNYAVYAVSCDSTVEALQKRAYERGVRDGKKKLFTRAEREALKDAAKEALAGMFQGNIKALERALEKL